MPTEVEVALTDEGRLALRGNELLLYDRTSGDPVAIRWRTNNETKGKLCADVFVADAWREVGYMSAKLDERGRTDPAHRDAVEWEWWSHIPGQGWNDANYERVFAIRHDGPVFYKGMAPTHVSRFYTDHGKFCINWQDDTSEAAGIVYSTNDGSADESTWVAVGKVRIDPL